MVASNMLSAFGVAPRVFRLRRPAPAMCAITPSNTSRSRSSALKPSYRNVLRKRPLCEDPKAMAWRTAPAVPLADGYFSQDVTSRRATSPSPATGTFDVRNDTS